MRTKEEIDAEIAKLKEMKPRVLKRNAFGDDHHEAIDAQIDVLENRMTEDEVYDWDDEGLEDDERPHQNIMDQGLYAAQWLAGEEEEAPSDSWKPLLRE